MRLKKDQSTIKKPVVKLSFSGELIDTYNSIAEAKIQNEYSYDEGIIATCSGRRYSAHGYNWMHLDEYNKLITTGRKNELLKTPHEKSIVKLNLNFEYISEYTSIKSAANELGLINGSAIIGVCQGKRKTAYGFRWMYLSEYEKKYGKIDE